MLRIPGSINSKNGQAIRIFQRWYGYKPPINCLLRNFRRYLIDEKLKGLRIRQTREKNLRWPRTNDRGVIPWIEKLLLMPLENQVHNRALSR
jgi:hypothetical protein